MTVIGYPSGSPPIPRSAVSSSAVTVFAFSCASFFRQEFNIFCSPAGQISKYFVTVWIFASFFCIIKKKLYVFPFVSQKIRGRGCIECSTCKRPVCGNAFLPFFLILSCCPLRPFCLPGGCRPCWAMTGTAKPSSTVISAMARNTESSSASPNPNTKN